MRMSRTSKKGTESLKLMNQPPYFYLETCPIAVSIPPTLSIVLPARRTIRLVFAGRELYAASAMPVAQNAVPTPAAVKKVFAALFIFISSVILLSILSFPPQKILYTIYNGRRSLMLESFLTFRNAFAAHSSARLRTLKAPARDISIISAHLVTETPRI